MRSHQYDAVELLREVKGRDMRARCIRAYPAGVRGQISYVADDDAYVVEILERGYAPALVDATDADLNAVAE
ncbi:hypothetical protein CMK11_02965 [Candidatus Poribacteria bacterium]|nr:hypothetical protein [Candidatus Poribacteria bacterium]